MFVISTIVMQGIVDETPFRVKNEKQSTGEALKEGWHTIWKNPIFRSIHVIFFIEAIANVVWVAAILYGFVNEVLHVTEAWWSYINTAFFLGLIFGGVISSRFSVKVEKNMRKILIYSSFLCFTSNLIVWIKFNCLDGLNTGCSKWISKGLAAIKTKVNYPFIYFLMEPNVVFVYKMKTNHYLTVSDWIESGELQTFELNHEDEFETFTHENSAPLEGKGYLMQQSDMTLMVEKINKYIQKYRQLHTFSAGFDEAGYKTSTVHLVSSESAAGILRVGLERPKVVIGFPDSLSIGPLWKLDEKVGQTFRNEWLYEHINYEGDDYEYENKFANALREIEDIPGQNPIYIWYGNNADEQIGLRFLLYLLRNKTNVIYLINSTELYERYIAPNLNGQTVLHTGHIEPEDLRWLYEKNSKSQSLSDQDINQYHKEWISLSQSKEVLRLWRDHEIAEVNENNYDPLIIKTIEMLHHGQESKDFIKAGMVIGEILSGTNESINAFFLEYRIRHLIYSGVLELKGIPKSMRHYGVKLR
ncbi:DUF1835 domain-containing protein [Bacillus sp. REN16]|uniref:DUF1835 domain-containing protein n=1 Tax=Bacillus sp. REN16 TaxID=2887296 RepID=UPI001E2C0B0C|nr:DUF1835 domain-containing protein [Bacillus sp. REN16]MCC3355640.1 DUF1835 domain-containing protein [Bacillus sp. REN16]